MKYIAAYLLVACFTIALTSCQAVAPAPTSPLAEPTPPDGLPRAPSPGEAPPPPPESWAADGVIDNREYLREMSYGDYELFWVNDEQYIYIAMKARTSGWVALGIQPGSRMKDADMIFGFVKDGQVIVLDLFSTGDFGPHSPDVELGGTSDIPDFGGKESDGYTIIEFKRALNTGDRYDLPLSSGKNQIIWAYGSADNPNMKHANRGYGELTLIW